jgi:hypothetical protein
MNAVRGVGEGFAFLATQPVLLMTFVVDIIAMLFAWPQAVFPELSQTTSGTSATLEVTPTISEEPESS